MNEQIEQLEFQLAEMPPAKRLGIYLFLVVALVFGSWNYFGEDLNLEIETEIDSIHQLESKLQKNSIKSIERNIKKTKKEILTIKEQISIQTYKDQFIRSKLDSMDFMFYNSMGIAKVLDHILKSSLSYGINIGYIESEKKHIAYSVHIVEKEQIAITGSGSFKSIMGLIQYIDSFKTLLRIKEITVDIDEEQNTNFTINILLYGVEL